MNIELLLKVKQHILEEPKRLNMIDWIILNPTLKESDDSNLNRIYENIARNLKQKGLLPNCGTVACIGGWSYLLSQQKEKESLMYNEILNIKNNNLFHPNMWPSNFRAEYDTINYYEPGLTPLEKSIKNAELVGRVIDDFIATEEWTYSS